MKHNPKDSTAAKPLPNAEVIKAFIMRQPARSATISTDGQTMWSYSNYELAKRKGDVIIYRSGGVFSRTTLKHLNLLLRALENQNIAHCSSRVETPFDQYVMNTHPDEGAPAPAGIQAAFDRDKETNAGYMQTVYGSMEDK